MKLLSSIALSFNLRCYTEFVTCVGHQIGIVVADTQVGRCRFRVQTVNPEP